MGLDGGCVLKRPDMVRTKQAAARRKEQKERNIGFSNCCWLQCTLTGCPLENPIVVSIKGQFFNRSSILEALLDNSLPKRLHYLRQKRNWKEVDLLGANNLVSYACPISRKSPSPGTVDSWVVIFKCGHLFLEESLKQVKAHECPVCGMKFEDSDVVNVTPLHQSKADK